MQECDLATYVPVPMVCFPVELNVLSLQLAAVL